MVYRMISIGALSIVLLLSCSANSSSWSADDYLSPVSKVNNIILSPERPLPGEEAAVYLDITDNVLRPQMVGADRPCPEVVVSDGIILAQTPADVSGGLEVVTGKSLQVYGPAFLWVMPYGIKEVSITASLPDGQASLSIPLDFNEDEYLKDLWIVPSDPEPGNTVTIGSTYKTSFLYPDSLESDTPILEYSVTGGVLQLNATVGVTRFDDRHLKCRWRNVVRWQLPSKVDSAVLTVRIRGADNILKVRFKDFVWTEAQDRARP